MVLPEALRKSRGIKAGTSLRVTEAGESNLLTPVHPPTEAELTAVIEAAGGPGHAETAKSANKWRQRLKESGRAREKPRTVIDTNVFVAAIFWQGSARECLARFARRQFQMFVTEVVLEEYAETAWDLKIEEHLVQSPQ